MHPLEKIIRSQNQTELLAWIQTEEAKKFAELLERRREDVRRALAPVTDRDLRRSPYLDEMIIPALIPTNKEEADLFLRWWGTFRGGSIVEWLQTQMRLIEALPPKS